jgi:hypothetical protein
MIVQLPDFVIARLACFGYALFDHLFAIKYAMRSRKQLRTLKNHLDHMLVVVLHGSSTRIVV